MGRARGVLPGLRPHRGQGRAGGREGERLRPQDREPLAERGATETAQMGGSYVAVFHEDPHPGGKVADPRKTPYSVLCVEAITMRTVEAHVEGTPKTSP